MAEFSVSSGNTTVTFSYTADTDKMLEIINAVSEYLWQEFVDYESGEVSNPFSEATNKEKLNVVEKFIKEIILSKANAVLKKKTVEALDKYSLNWGDML